VLWSAKLLLGKPREGSTDGEKVAARGRLFFKAWGLFKAGQAGAWRSIGRGLPSWSLAVHRGGGRLFFAEDGLDLDFGDVLGGLGLGLAEAVDFGAQAGDFG